MTSGQQPEYYSFDDEAVANVLNTLRQSHEGVNLYSGELAAAPESSVDALAQCIGVIIRNNQVCLRIPVVNRDVCIRLPVPLPDGRVAEACLSICSFGPFPTGVCVEIKVGGVRIIRQCFGRC